MNILVTGANGFVGRVLCNHIADQGLNPYGLLRNTQEDLNVKTQFIVKDFLNHSDWEPILKGMDAVIHTAGLAHVRGCSDKDYYDINTEITKKLALECAKAKIKRFVYISSVAVYGIHSSKKIVTLATPLHPTTPYGHSKLLAEEYLKELQEKKELEVVIIRPPLIYGANAPGNIDFLLKAIKYNCPLPFARVENLRSMVYVKNLCDCLIKCAIAAKASGNIFLVSDYRDISTPSLIKILSKKINKNPKLFLFPLKIFNMLLSIFGKEAVLEKITGSLQLDISHIQKTIGWNPPFSIEQGLGETAQSFRA